MNQVQVLIVEDEPVISEYIAECIERYGYQVMAKCYSMQDVLSTCKKKTPDIALMDINLGDEVDGIDLAHHLTKEYDFPIIFITSYTDETFLERAKKVNPAAYLVKPFDENTLKATIAFALHNYDGNSHSQMTPAERPVETDSFYSVKESFFIKSKGRFIKVAYRDILWMEANDAYSMLYTADGRHMVHHSLKKMEEKIPSSIFMRIHRSFIVNFNRVEEVSNDYVTIGSQQISIGKSYRSAVFDRLDLL